MGEPDLRWTDAPEFHWTPDEPFYVGPQFKDAPPAPEIFETPEAANSAPSYLLSRLMVGALQGVGLVLLAAGHGHSMLASSLRMVMLFAPLLLLAGFGRVPGKLLLPWTAIAGVCLAVLGGYQFWRGGDIGMVALVLAGLALFIGQAMIMAWARDGEPLASYPAFYRAAWSMGVLMLVCGLVAMATFVVGGAAANLLRQNFPGAHMLLPVAPLVTLAVALTTWLLSPSRLWLLTHWAQTLLTLALVPATLFAAAAAIAALLLQPPPVLLDIGLGAALVLGINASYRDGADRPRWRELMEFAASLALVPLVILGGLALADRVALLGWTAPRILATAALGVLGAYAVTYLVSALVSLGGGGWMQRLERANLVIALAMLDVIAGLASPPGDPVRLSVQNQVKRLESGLIPAQRFDFNWLRNQGERFGHDALMKLSATNSRPELARDAYLTLLAAPSAGRPAPTEIGANIRVRTPYAKLPASLLAPDWSKFPQAGIPPCLTSAALFCDAYFIDLDNDGLDEIVLVYGSDTAWWAGVMKQGHDGWYPAGTLASPHCSGSLDALRAGRFAPVSPLPGWRDLMVGGNRLSVALSGVAKNAACPR